MIAFLGHLRILAILESQLSGLDRDGGDLLKMFSGQRRTDCFVHYASHCVVIPLLGLAASDMPPHDLVQVVIDSAAVGSAADSADGWGADAGSGAGRPAAPAAVSVGRT